MLSHNAQIHTHGTISLSTYQVAQTVKRLPTMRETRFDPWVGKIPWRRKRQPTTVFMPGKSHGRGSLGGYTPWGSKESDTTERLPCVCVCVCVCVWVVRTENFHYFLSSHRIKLDSHKSTCASNILKSPLGICNTYFFLNAHFRSTDNKGLKS